MLNDKEKVIEVIEKLPNDISINEILEVLNLMITLNTRIDEFNIDESLSSKELLEEIKKW